MSNGFIKLPRSLLTSPEWLDLSYEYRHIFMTILVHMAYKPITQNNHGIMMDLQVGELMTTYRNLAKLCHDPKIDRNMVDRALKRLNELGFSRHEQKTRQNPSQNSSQKMRQEKTIITVTEPRICELLKLQSESENESELKSENVKKRDIKEEYRNKKKKEKNEKKEKFDSVEKTTYRPLVTLYPHEYEALLSKHGIDFLNEMMDILNSYKGRSGKIYQSDYFAMDSGSWVVKETEKQLSKKEKSPETIREKMLKVKQEFFSDHYQIEVGANDVAIVSLVGQSSPMVFKFHDQGFETVFMHELKRRGFKNKEEHNKKVEPIANGSRLQ